MKKKDSPKTPVIQLKFLLLGEDYVGKTAFLERYIVKTFKSNYLATIGMDTRLKRLEINNTDVDLYITDTAGQERFRSLTKMFFKANYGFILLFNLTRKKTFEQVSYWIEQIENNKSKDYPIHSVLVGNFCDKKEDIEIKEEDIKIIQDKYNIKYFEVSSKDGTNIDAVFEYLSKITLKSRGLLNKIGLDDNASLEDIKIIESENQKNEFKKIPRKKKKGFLEKIGIFFKSHNNENNENKKKMKYKILCNLINILNFSSIFN